MNAPLITQTVEGTSVLQDKVCFITGGARGIGLGIARACAARGAKIAIADIDDAALAAAGAELPAGCVAHMYHLDVRDREAFSRLADRVEDELGPVTAVFNNAGIIDSVAPAVMKGAVWDWMVDVNLHGVYNGVQAFIPRMIARGEGGYLVNTSSMAGLIPVGSGFAYHATKFAVVGLTESLRYEVARHNISVSVVVPGRVATSIVQNVQQMRPPTAEEHTSTIARILSSSHETLLKEGVSIDDAGGSIVEGMLAGQPYIYTDGGYRQYLQDRTAMLLACLPEDPASLTVAQEA